MRNIKFFEEFESSDFSNQRPERIHENHEGQELQNYMFFQNLYTLERAIEELLDLDPEQVDKILSDGHGWALDHIATSADDIEEVYNFLANSIEMGHKEEGHEMSMGGEDHHGEDHGDDDDDDDDEDENQPIEIEVQGDDDNVEVETEEE